MRKLLLFITFTSILYSSAEQIWLPNNIWSLVSYKGIYTSSNKPRNWNDDLNFEIQDRADEFTTYVAPNTAMTDHLYITPTGLSANLASGGTTEVGATIGVFAIKDTVSPLENIKLDGANSENVRLKVSTVHAKDNTYSMYSMYIAGKSNKPAVRIYFQANYQGETFRVKFGNGKISYVGKFDYRNTFDNPRKIVDESTITQSNKMTKSPILDVFDFNITDNNATKMVISKFTKDNDIKKLSSSSGESLVINSYSQNGIWKTYNSGNANSQANDFNDLEVGKAYWIKAKSDLATNDANQTRLGLITSVRPQIKDDYLDNVENGWNLLMFDDAYIRVATTGLFISNTAPLPALNFYINRPDGNFIHTGSPMVFSVSTATGVGEAYKEFNAIFRAVYALYGIQHRVRAFPAYQSAAQQSMIILSDEKIYFSAAAAAAATVKTLTGEDVQRTIQRNGANFVYSSKYGEYMLIADINNLTGTNIVSVMNILTPSITSTPAITANLNTAKATQLTSIVTALNTSVTNSAGEVKTKSAVYFVDIDTNDSKNYGNAGGAAYLNFLNSVLLASGERFSISDNTYTKAYKYKRNGDFRIVGSVTRDVKMDNNVSIADLQTQFNAVSADTDVIFTRLGQDTNNEYFAITSDKVSNLDLLEDESNGTTLFEEISLDSTVIPEANRSRMQGAISKVFTTSNILDSSINLDYPLIESNNMLFGAIVTRIANNITTTTGPSGGYSAVGMPYTTMDLKSNPVWSLDFPVDSIVDKFADKNKRVDIVLSSELGSGGTLFWQTTDLTKDPQDWYGNNYNDKKVFDNDLQGVFKIKSNKAYWVKLSSKTKVLGTLQSSSTLSKNTIPHFDNSVKSKDDPVSPTSNDLNYKLVLYFNKNFINPLSKSFYDVVALIDGKRYHLRSSGSNFQLDIRNKEMSLIQKKAGSSAYPIIIEASDGLGNTFKETAKTAKFKIDYVQPPTPKIEYDEVSEINVLNKGNYKVEAYANYISDIESVRMKDMMDFNLTHHITRFKDMIGWEKEDSTPENEGLPTLVKVVNKNKSTGMYSDAQTLIYAPLKFGHVLEVNASDKDGVDNLPYSFIQKQPLTKQSVNSDKKILFNGVNGINGGVQLTRQAATKTTLGYKGVKLAYYPAGGENKEDSNELSRFGGRYTMYLKVNSSDNDPIASITYITDLVGKVFYVEYDSKLYIGRFAGNDNFNTDASSYILNSTSQLDVVTLESGTSFNLDANGRYINFGSTLPYQKIYNGVIPKTYQDKLDAFLQVSKTPAKTPAAKTPAATTPATTGGGAALPPI